MTFSQTFPLAVGRAHEVSGPGACLFAAILCGSQTGKQVGGTAGRPALWLVERWQRLALNPHGLACFCAPDRMLVAQVEDAVQMQACAEEALRSGAVSVVVADVTEPLSFTAGRRLQLAAELGRATGLLLIGEGMGNNAAESRWHCTPLHDVASGGRFCSFGDSTLQRWQLIKNKKGTLGFWDIAWDAAAHRIIVVSEAGQRSDLAAASA